MNDKSSRRQLAPKLLALCCAGALAPAWAQGIWPGQLSEQGYKLPGGFEPVVQLRTFYLESESVTGAQSAAWALGGWAGLRSPWWGDVFQLGLLGYTSQKLYGPEDKDGTRLLAPGQEPITVLGEAFAAVRVFDQTLTAYRQLINRPFINPQDSRMVPNTFEAYTVTGDAGDLAYTGGYITKMKARNSEDFDWMSTAAKGGGEHQGVVYAGATWDFMKNGSLRIDEQYGIDVFNTFYSDVKFPIAISDKTTLTLGAQYAAQKSIGEAQIGNFQTWGGGLQAAMSWGPMGAQLYYTQTSNSFDTQNPFGDHPSYLNMMQVAFNTAGEKAWGLGGNVNFGSMGMPGFTAAALYASGRDRITAATGAALPDREEFNLRADYAFPKGTVLEGLVATLRGSWLRQDGGMQTAPQLRAYLNYSVRF